MDDLSIKNDIKGFILENSDLTQLDEDYDIIENRVLDSFTIVSLVSFLEEKYECSFDFDELNEESFKSINALCSLVKNKVNS